MLKWLYCYSNTGKVFKIHSIEAPPKKKTHSLSFGSVDIVENPNPSSSTNNVSTSRAYCGESNNYSLSDDLQEDDFDEVSCFNSEVRHVSNNKTCLLFCS